MPYQIWHCFKNGKCDSQSWEYLSLSWRLRLRPWNLHINGSGDFRKWTRTLGCHIQKFRSVLSFKRSIHYSLESCSCVTEPERHHEHYIHATRREEPSFLDIFISDWYRPICTANVKLGKVSSCSQLIQDWLRDGQAIFIPFRTSVQTAVATVNLIVQSHLFERTTSDAQGELQGWQIGGSNALKIFLPITCFSLHHKAEVTFLVYIFGEANLLSVWHGVQVVSWASVVPWK